jgi:hypothetical protein
MDFIARLVEPGRKTARAYYDAGGWDPAPNADASDGGHAEGFQHLRHFHFVVRIDMHAGRLVAVAQGGIKKVNPVFRHKGGFSCRSSYRKS